MRGHLGLGEWARVDSTYHILGRAVRPVELGEACDLPSDRTSRARAASEFAPAQAVLLERAAPEDQRERLVRRASRQPPEGSAHDTEVAAAVRQKSLELVQGWTVSREAVPRSAVPVVLRRAPLPRLIPHSSPASSRSSSSAASRSKHCPSFGFAIPASTSSQVADASCLVLLLKLVHPRVLEISNRPRYPASCLLQSWAASSNASSTAWFWTSRIRPRTPASAVATRKLAACGSPSCRDRFHTDDRRRDNHAHLPTSGVRSRLTSPPATLSRVCERTSPARDRRRSVARAGFDSSACHRRRKAADGRFSRRSRRRRARSSGRAIGPRLPRESTPFAFRLAPYGSTRTEPSPT